MLFTLLIGMANPSPMLPWFGVKITELTPMTWPAALNSGPPELPGLMAASVWMAPPSRSIWLPGTWDSSPGLRRALTILRADGIDAHGQVAHPDPFTAAVQAVQDERIDEIIVSTFAPSKSPWLRRDLIQRLHKATNLPVEHVVLQEEQAAVT